MTINIVPNPLTTEPQSIGTEAAPWTAVHTEQAHLSYIRLHAFTEDISGHSQQVQNLQNLYSNETDDNSMSVFSSVLHMRLDGLYVGHARVVLHSEIDTVNGKLLAFFGDTNSQHLGIKSHYEYLEDGWDSLVQIVARIKGLASQVTDLSAQVSALELGSTPSTGGGATVLGDLTDVAISTTNLSTHLFLKYTGAEWENAEIAYSDITGTPSLLGFLTQTDTDALYVSINAYNTLAGTVADHGTRLSALEGATITPLSTSGGAGNINVATSDSKLASTSWFIDSTNVMTMAGHILPNTNAGYDLGSAEKKIRHLYLSDNSIIMSPAYGAAQDRATRISFDAYAGGLVSSTERRYSLSELDSEFGPGALLVLEALINYQEYETTDAKTGKTIRITGDYSYWSTAVGTTTADHDGQILTYTVRYTLNRDNVVVQQGTGISVQYDSGAYTVAVDDTTIATREYVDAAVAAVVDTDTTYTAALPLSIDSSNQISIDSAAYTYTAGDGIDITGNTISLGANSFVEADALSAYQQSLSVEDSSELVISSSNVLSLNALDPYRPGLYGNVPADGADIPVSQVRGAVERTRDGALLPYYSDFNNVYQAVSTEYTYANSTVMSDSDYSGVEQNLHKVISTPNTSMYFVPVLGDQKAESTKTEWAETIFGSFHTEMLQAGWQAPTAQALYDTNAGKITIGLSTYTAGERVSHPALHVIENSGYAPTIHIPADGIIDEPLIARAYLGTSSSVQSGRGNVFLYTLDQERVGLDEQQTRKVLAIGPVMRYRDNSSAGIKTTITPMYGLTESDSPETFSQNPTDSVYSSSVVAPLEAKVADAATQTTDILEVGYYIVWDSTVIDPDSGAVPHGANLRFFRDATVFIENEGSLSHVSYQNAWLPTVTTHEEVRLPNSASFQDLYVNHLEVTSNSSALFTNGVQILNTDVCDPLGGNNDHDTMDSGLVVVTSGALVDVLNESNQQEQVKKINTFTSLYYDSSADQWRITKGTNGASVSGGVGAYVSTDGTLTALNDSDGRPTSGLRGTRIDTSAAHSERILTESDISDFVSANTLDNYATAASVATLTSTVDNLSLTTTLEDLTDVNITSGNLTDGQYLKWDNTLDKWVAGDTSDFTTGVTTVNGTSGAVILDSGDISEGSNLYYTDTRVGAYLTANSYATEGYVDTAVSGLASTQYVDNAVTALVDGAPGVLDTLNELAAALGDDANFATTTATSIAAKADKSQTITAGTGIVTAGSLGSGVTVSLATVTNDVGTFGSATKVPSITVDTYGRVTAATLVDVNNFSGNYADLTNTPTLFDGDYSSLTGAPTLFSGSYADLSDLPTLFDGAYASLTGAPTLSNVATTGSYNDLSDTPTLFSGSYVDLTNKPTLFDGAYASLTGAPTLSAVATTGSYEDLTDTPALFDGAYASLTGAPSLSTVATTGSYNDLSDKPSLFSESYNDLTDKPALFDGAYASLTGAPTLSTVATTGSYNDLADKPALFDGTYASLTGTPDLSDNATQTYVTAAVSDFITASSVSLNYALASSLTSTKIIDLADVNVTAASLSNGQYLKWDGSAWVRGSASDFTTGVTSITAGTGIDVGTGTGAVTVSVDSTVATAVSLAALDASKQDAFTVGTGLTLSGGTLSATVSLAGLASETYVDNAVNGLVDAAPGALNTLNELAAALGDDANFSTTVTNSIATKADATATANSITNLSGRLDDVEAYTITLADNQISVDGGVIAAQTLTNSLSATMATALGISTLATAASLSEVKDVVDGRVNVTSLGTGLTLSSGVLSATVDLTGYSTSTQIADTYLTKTDASATYADATATASSLSTLDSRLDVVEAYAINIAGNSIAVNGGSLAAATLSQSLSSAMAEDLSISSLATAASLSALKTTVDAREHITSIGDGLAFTNGELSAAVDLSSLATAATLSNYVLTSTADSTYANALSTASSISALDGRLDTIEGDYLTSASTLQGSRVSGSISGQAGSVLSLSGHSISLAGNTISLNGGSITAASLSDSLKTEMATDLNISSLATGSSLTAVSSRVTSIEDDYLTSSTELSSANLDNEGITLAGLGVNLGGTITAASLSDSLKTEMRSDLGIDSLATAAALSSGLAGKQDTLSIASGSKLSLSSNELDVDLSTYALSADYTTTATLTSLLNAKQDSVSAGSNIAITGTSIAVSSTLSNAVAANTAKTGITAAQASAITANTAKTGYTDTLARGAISATGDVSYNSSTGVVSYTSQWATDSGKITTENVVLVPGHLIEVFDMGTINSSADFSMDAGVLSGSIDRVVECGILDQERLF